ncbi:OmpH family outer membrane protein [Gluconacetobacter takamatsuzukensis]|uniref:OmpH family outer membrane protein n=1 Tax=Gluconacetobacter takamatsuzukensis TaxID=1286190 RepID=A0A7W4KBM5_9PROT|nr:OmpH family outer membrane protein [Gluconacetobacter takamatsuzukensis]MBB2203972.1 OmpH family outer membrane protein [Gluconacetobacter takamatsuzukensis]
MTDISRTSCRRFLAGFFVVTGMGAALAPAFAAAPAARAAAPAAAPAAPDQPPLLPAPPVPDFAPLPPAAKPPAPVVGVFDTDAIMRQSVAIQEVEKEMGTRRDALIRDVRAEEGQIQALRQQMMNAARPEAEAQQRSLQQRVAVDQRTFGNRNRILEEDIQIALNQVQREIGQVVNSVAKARGLTLVVQSGLTVLHGPQVDISDQVASRLNAILPHVYLPAANEDPEVIAKSGKFPTAPVQMADPQQQQQG